MDWQNQPNPFRFYHETPVIELPLLTQDPVAAYPDLYCRQHHQHEPLTLKTVAGLLELSLGLSAWKAAGQSKWSLRMNPSSGNLHPTEAHLILPDISGLPAGVYHYNVLNHALEQRALIPQPIWPQIRRHFGCDGFFIGLSSIYWRESWKYGERAFRYCNHDIGHAVAAVSISANLFGWKATYLNGLADDSLNKVFGFDRSGYEDLESEEPDLLCFVHHPNQPIDRRSLAQSIIRAFSELEVCGKPNQLSRQPVNWEAIYHTAEQSRKPQTVEKIYDYGTSRPIETSTLRTSAAGIIRQRRSATDFDRSGSLNMQQLLAILDKTLPRNDGAPFDAGLGHISTHLLLFVHRVAELNAGLYFLCRNNKDLESLQDSMRSSFAWQPVKSNFPLYLLTEGNYQQQATRVSCHQDIAGSSVFSIGMIARFRSPITSEPFRYRQLFWETGMIGQVLYLEAEAHGVRGTGIGCFFDDAVHDILGLSGNRYQSLYHFTIGRPIEDPRLTTYPAYHHLSR
jgi:SagB-type dehydrogenase family enzyme